MRIHRDRSDGDGERGHILHGSLAVFCCFGAAVVDVKHIVQELVMQTLRGAELLTVKGNGRTHDIAEHAVVAVAFDVFVENDVKRRRRAVKHRAAARKPVHGESAQSVREVVGVPLV